MMKWLYHLATLYHDRRADFAQYALLLALIVVVSIGVVTGLGTDIQSTFQSVRNAF